MSKLIISTIEKACISFKKSVDSFDLRAIKDGGKNNGFPERNLSFHFAKCFDGFAFMEVPFEGSNRKRNDNHIDFFVGNKNIRIFGETKRLYSIGKLREICGDAKRLSNKNVLKRILERAKIKTITETYALILAEAWEIKNPDKKYKEYKFSEWWKSSNYDWRGWEKWAKERKGSKLKNFTFGSQELISIGDYNVQCLYAYQRIW